MNKQLNQLIYKDPIQVGNNVLLHKPQSAIAHISHLPLTGSYQVIKMNDMVLQIANEHGKISLVHHAYIRHFVPWPDHLNYTILPLASQAFQMMPDSTPFSLSDDHVNN